MKAPADTPVHKCCATATSNPATPAPPTSTPAPAPTTPSKQAPPSDTSCAQSCLLPATKGTGNTDKHKNNSNNNTANASGAGSSGVIGKDSGSGASTTHDTTHNLCTPATPLPPPFVPRHLRQQQQQRHQQYQARQQEQEGEHPPPTRDAPRSHHNPSMPDINPLTSYEHCQSQLQRQQDPTSISQPQYSNSDPALEIHDSPDHATASVEANSSPQHHTLPSHSQNDVAGMNHVESTQQLREKILAQIEYYFSRKNLTTDTYLVSKMDSQMFVPISVVASFNMVRQHTTDLPFIVSALKTSPNLVVDEDSMRVRPKHFKTERNTLVLRDLPADVSEAEVRSLFSDKDCATIRSVSPEIGGCCYVCFESEQEAVKMLWHVKEKCIRGKKVAARIKNETILKNFHLNGKPSYPMRLSYDGMTAEPQGLAQEEYFSAPNGYGDAAGGAFGKEHGHVTAQEYLDAGAASLGWGPQASGMMVGHNHVEMMSAVCMSGGYVPTSSGTAAPNPYIASESTETLVASGANPYLAYDSNSSYQPNEMALSSAAPMQPGMHVMENGYVYDPRLGAAAYYGPHDHPHHQPHSALVNPYEYDPSHTMAVARASSAGVTMELNPQVQNPPILMPDGQVFGSYGNPYLAMEAHYAAAASAAAAAAAAAVEAAGVSMTSPVNEPASPSYTSPIPSQASSSGQGSAKSRKSKRKDFKSRNPVDASSLSTGNGYQCVQDSQKGLEPRAGQTVSAGTFSRSNGVHMSKSARKKAAKAAAAAAVGPSQSFSANGHILSSTAPSPSEDRVSKGARFPGQRPVTCVTEFVSSGKASHRPGNGGPRYRSSAVRCSTVPYGASLTRKGSKALPAALSKKAEQPPPLSDTAEHFPPLPRDGARVPESSGSKANTAAIFDIAEKQGISALKGSEDVASCPQSTPPPPRLAMRDIVKNLQPGQVFTPVQRGLRQPAWGSPGPNDQETQDSGKEDAVDEDSCTADDDGKKNANGPQEDRWGEDDTDQRTQRSNSTSPSPSASPSAKESLEYKKQALHQDAESGGRYPSANGYHHHHYRPGKGRCVGTNNHLSGSPNSPRAMQDAPNEGVDTEASAGGSSPTKACSVSDTAATGTQTKSVSSPCASAPLMTSYAEILMKKSREVSVVMPKESGNGGCADDDDGGCEAAQGVGVVGKREAVGA